MGVTRAANSSGASFSDLVAIDVPGGRWLHVSGQLPIDESGQAVRGDLATQAAACFARMADHLSAAGAGLESVIKITAYLTSLDGYPAYGAARRKAFGDSLPASSAVMVAGLLDGAAVEIDAVAFVAG
jgi:2-iminobutanoate/2-iminopropanoate deaminase